MGARERLLKPATIRLFLPLFALLAATLLADSVGWPIVIDGYDNDWTTWDSRNEDPNERGIPDNQDLALNLFKWDPDAETCYFYYRTYQRYNPPGNNDDASAILIDADMNSSTGGTYAGRSGLEYYLWWDLGPSSHGRYLSTATLYVWDGTSWVAGGSYAVARADMNAPDYTFVEWSLPGSALPTSNGYFYWSAWLQSQDQQDWCPDTVTQVGFVPEPSTWALVGLGLGLVAWAKRRRWA
jgi:hypothetical protein